MATAHSARQARAGHSYGNLIDICDAHHIALNCFRANLFYTCRSGGPAIFRGLRRQPLGSIILIQGLADDSLGRDQSCGHFCNGFGRRFRPLTLGSAGIGNRRRIVKR